jgi:calcineurin-like phosphoesterase family protein
LSVLFTSDLHFNHLNSAKRRGFESIEAHDNAVIESLNKRCGKRTVLYVLGDVGFEIEGIDKLRQINGRIRIILGNHDYHAEYYRAYAEYVGGMIKYKNMWLTHCPIHPQEMFKCVANVHGHIHNGGATDNLGFPYINVNWDFNYKPVSLDEIKKTVEIRGKEVV